jgi:pectin methylesterase-like acyl-CoA thioesterase
MSVMSETTLQNVPIAVDGTIQGAVASAAEAQQGEIQQAAALANTATVFPGGAQFSSIQSAINSIQNAGPSKVYIVVAGPGTYNERVTLKPYVALQGAGQGQTTVSAAAQSSQGVGTLTAASNSLVADLLVQSVGGSWGNWSTALACNDAANFVMSNVKLYVTDQGNAGINMRAAQFDIYANTGSTVVLSQVSVSMSASSQSVPIGLMTYKLANLTVVSSTLISIANSYATPVYGGSSGSILISDSVIQGKSYALQNGYPGANTMIAVNCQITGPVSSGVLVLTT